MWIEGLKVFSGNVKTALINQIRPTQDFDLKPGGEICALTRLKMKSGIGKIRYDVIDAAFSVIDDIVGKAVPTHPILKPFSRCSESSLRKFGSVTQPISWPNIILVMISMVNAFAAEVMHIGDDFSAASSNLFISCLVLARIAGASSCTREPVRAGARTFLRTRCLAGFVSPISVPGYEILT